MQPDRNAPPVAERFALATAAVTRVQHDRHQQRNRNDSRRAGQQGQAGARAGVLPVSRRIHHRIHAAGAGIGQAGQDAEHIRQAQQPKHQQKYPRNQNQPQKRDEIILFLMKNLCDRVIGNDESRQNQGHDGETVAQIFNRGMNRAGNTAAQPRQAQKRAQHNAHQNRIKQGL